ncbi:MAG: signal recognition particle-docking protein FtsY [Eubacteriales bacterium]|nr:signal recognition particle-docking protein FtsY [Eubacteriales bacterium]
MDEQEKLGFWGKLKSSMKKTRDSLGGRIDELVKYYKEIDDEFFEELEAVLISADVGAEFSAELVERVRQQVKKQKIGDSSRIRELLQSELLAELGQVEPLRLDEKSVVMVVGVNGVGKTTSVGKLAANLQRGGKRVLLAAADTFRAAAAEQLKVWGERAGVDVISQAAGSDPAAVVFDAVQAAKARNVDVLVCDTAGRLHNKVNLMNELSKMRRIVDREYPGAHCETLLVLDATTGQNAVVQAKTFAQACDVTGIILTKLDGTAKGGVVIAIASQLGVPVRYIGVGEGIDDLQTFDAQSFVKAMFAEEGSL